MTHEIDTIISTLKQEVNSELAPLFDDFEDLYERKLWHQLTEKLAIFFHDSKSESFRLRLYTQFVSKFIDKINQLNVVEFLLQALQENDDTEESLQYLKDLQKEFKEIDEKKQRNDGLKPHVDGNLLLDIEIARVKLEKGDLVEVRDILDAIGKTLDVQDSVPLRVTGAYYSCNASYYQVKKDFNNFYYTSLLYLSTITSEEQQQRLTQLEQQQLAYNLCIAALLGDNIYNFGELLQHPIISSISNDKEYEWLFRFLNALTEGDFQKFDQISKERIPKVPILAQHESFLRQKICLMTLVESVFAKSIRTLSFRDIADATFLPIDSVEHLVMRSISLGLLKGSIDQVQQLVTITWVQPRIINQEQIKKMKDNLVKWQDEVSKLGNKIEGRGKSIWV
ncbi:Rpn9 [Kluyveromyces lactis]|nr:Rpn9 [Kluyveromyces lactis]